MNYRHIYHCGNFADVLKHTVLVALLAFLHQKPKPFVFLDTHAGLGLYPLNKGGALKTQEYQRGIGQLLALEASQFPEIMQNYLKIVHAVNTDGRLQHYPGSPWLAKHCLSAQDKMVVCELHPDDYRELAMLFKRDKQVAVHFQDGYLALKAFLPPKLQRGLVLIDPPFEAVDEFRKIKQGLSLGLTRWRQGVFMVWYPIKDNYQTAKFIESIRKLGADMLNIDFQLQEALPPGKLNRCGVIIINPPWQLDKVLKESLLPCLGEALAAKWRLC